MPGPPSRDLRVRLRPFLERGLIRAVPTPWQLLQGQLEMAPYVVMPDKGDSARYAGAPLGHPLLRQPLLLGEIGLDHLRVGHGLAAPLDSQLKHLAFVSHEGMPVYDLQLCQTHPDGLERLRTFLLEVDAGATAARRRQRRLASLIIPDAGAYRARFTDRGGYIDRAVAFDYPAPDVDFLRPEFSSLTHFVDYCLERFDPRPAGTPLWRHVAHLADLSTRRLRELAIR
ncbi:MAG: hypothetical protein CVU56_25960 [Deltaproteobacteria bacterium HGW-Deltaproteobacteria-14]|jgi:hypothetical protein|nr:MAG: hypothetical protein CVU56_25960 [Deltaproteobacteria bacterium HGW-Deltaproteobacteria-14]